MLQCRQLITGFLLQGAGYSYRLYSVGFVVNKVASRHSLFLYVSLSLSVSLSLCLSIPLSVPPPSLHSMYGATAPSGPWPPSKCASTRPCFQLFSSILLLPTAVMHPSEPRLPIWFLVFPLVLCCGSFHLKPFFGILSSSILIIWPAHPSLLIFVSSTMFRSLYRVYSSLFHLGRQCPPSCIGPYILRSIFICSVVCVRVQVTLP